MEAHKTFGRGPLDVLCSHNLCPASEGTFVTGLYIICMLLQIMLLTL